MLFTHAYNGYLFVGIIIFRGRKCEKEGGKEGRKDGVGEGGREGGREGG